MPVTFKPLSIGAEYTRPQLAELWGFQGYEAISRGIITPRGTNFIILFVTHEKQASLTQYDDLLADGLLKMDGEKGHAGDNRLINAQTAGDEVHLFYRGRHHSPFIYVGRVYLCDYELHTDRPSRFEFAVDAIEAQAISSLSTELKTHGHISAEFVPDAEGAARLSQHVSYERSRKNRAEALRIHGNRCAACGFDFDLRYGSAHSNGYIEVHHVRSLTLQQQSPINPRCDLVPLCSNWHSMVHRKHGEILSVEALRRLLESRSSK